MSYKFKKFAFQITVMIVIAVALRLLLDGFIADDWLRGISFIIAYLCGQLIARPFFERQWPEPKKGWSK